uniref:ZP domain-containing protein n=1 Tax=Salarias fasciatus TaxID=181472 RepID=A0A672JMU9_SALFA
PPSASWIISHPRMMTGSPGWRQRVIGSPGRRRPVIGSPGRRRRVIGCPVSPGKASVRCWDGKMAVVLEKASMPGIDVNFLRLQDPNCSLSANATHITGAMSLHTCGTTLEVSPSPEPHSPGPGPGPDLLVLVPGLGSSRVGLDVLSI